LVKIDGSLGTGELDVTRVIFLVHLAVLSNLQAQVLLVIQGLLRHDGFEA
jgi:hypothetical protein